MLIESFVSTDKAHHHRHTSEAIKHEKVNDKATALITRVNCVFVVAIDLIIIQLNQNWSFSLRLL